MTLCIAALAQRSSSPCIVLGFDKQVSGEGLSSQTEYKLQPLNGQLVALYAGSPGRAKELALIFGGLLKRVNLDYDNAVEQLREGILILKRRIAESYTALHFGLSYTDFLDNGIAWFGENFVNGHLGAIERIPLGVELIIAGFIDGKAVLFERRAGSDAELEWRSNFAAVGSGAYTAEPSMHYRNHTPGTDLETAIYNVFEAKKAGEQDPAVGEETHLFIAHPPSAHGDRIMFEYVGETGFSYLKRLWEDHRPRPLCERPSYPDGAILKGDY